MLADPLWWVLVGVFGVWAVNAPLEDLRKNGIDDEDQFNDLQNLERSVPAGDSRVDCASAASAYATQREGI